MSDEWGLAYDDVNAALAYDADTGRIWWKIKPARNVMVGMEAGAVKATRTGKDGKSVSYRYIRLDNRGIPASRIAWLLHYGEWPAGRLSFKDDNPLNLRIDNLVMAETVLPKAKAGNAEYMKNHREEFPLFWKERHLQSTFGISLHEYGQLLVAQDGKCGICGNEEAEARAGKTKALAVDHDHRTGKVRGLLCSACNTGLGKFGDDRERLLNALRYLDKHADGANVTAIEKGQN